ncbi:hypothetical protein TrST_g10764 [Triparma strigata]|uniref:GRIP domain-containing protein n=1 Tax=Triparma strigata TaxID=1606541 RepID=A0A9W7C4U9_9STRA|nr:hypothetical protein TrST_g10764 [Triparma strigata]
MFAGLADIAKGPLGERLTKYAEVVGDIVAPIIDDEEDFEGDYSEMANTMFGDGMGEQHEEEQLQPPFQEQQPQQEEEAPQQQQQQPIPSPARHERSESLQLEIRQLEDQLHESNNEYKHIMRENEKYVSSLTAENASLKSRLADLESEGASMRALQENNMQLESSLEQIQSIKQALASELVGVKTELEEMRQSNAKLGQRVGELGDELEEAEAEKRRMEVIIVGSSNTKTPAKMKGTAGESINLLSTPTGEPTAGGLEDFTDGGLVGGGVEKDADSHMESLAVLNNLLKKENEELSVKNKGLERDIVELREVSVSVGVGGAGTEGGEELEAALKANEELKEQLRNLREAHEGLVGAGAADISRSEELEEQLRSLKEAHEGLVGTGAADTARTDSLTAENQRLEEQLRDLREAHEGLANSQDIRISRIMEEAEANVAKAKREAMENNSEVAQLREIINNMRNSLSSSSDAADTYKNQLISLQADYERMSVDFNALSRQNEESRGVINTLQDLSSSSTDLQLEMKALKKVLDNEKERYQALEEERDDAEGRANEMRSRLVATSADLDIARTEAQQAQDSSNNLQMAMSKLQDERDAELGMMEQQRLDSLTAEQESWRTKLAATARLHEGEVQEIEAKHQEDLKAQQERYKKQEARLDETRADNVTLRRSLDEAIGRLQATQEEIIDRALMKNVLLDWHSKQGEERNAVMSIMASMLNFSDEEKKTAEVYDNAAGKEGVVRRIVGNIAAPMPQPAVNVNELEGDTVSDKFQAFLLAEIGD